MNYILDDNKQIVHEPDFISWAQWFETANRHIGDETIGESRISTVFLGIDHSFGRGAPVLWETMVFGGELDGEMDRCSGDADDAKSMHSKMVKRVKG